MRKPLSPAPGTHGRCPKCKNTITTTLKQDVTSFYARELTTCRCGATWEPIAQDLLWDETDPACSFSEPCDNCAFRPGSVEQQDTAKWRETMKSLRAGAAFYCHKGVPISPESEDGFDYPKDRPKQLRLCRGYLNAWGAWMRKDYPAEAKADD